MSSGCVLHSGIAIVPCVQLILQLLTNNRQIRRCLDADSHSVSADAYNGHRDVFTDENPLSDSATEYEHFFACWLLPGFTTDTCPLHDRNEARSSLIYRGRFEMSGAKRPFSPESKAAAGQRKMPLA